MSGPQRLELAAMGALRPPADGVVTAARRREAQRFDAIWWPDHQLHWFPDAIWTADLVPQAAAQPSPHVWFDPVPVVGAVALATRELRLGIGVTDLVRRHPAAAAQTALTLDHLSGGRFMLGVGAGEALNLVPYGLPADRGMARLEEGLDVLRRLLATHEPVDFEGEFFQLRGASMGLGPQGDAPPPVWVAAHRPRGLALVGRVADGWLPLVTDPAEYGDLLGVVRAAASAAGRDPDDVTPGLYARVVLAERAEDAAAVVDGSLLLRFIALTRPAEAYAVHGAPHPLGEGAFGLTSFVPTRYDRASALALADAVPAGVVRDTVLHGTPDDVAERIEAFAAAGARHVQLTNMTPMAAPDRAAASEGLLGELVERLRAGERRAAKAS